MALARMRVPVVEMDMHILTPTPRHDEQSQAPRPPVLFVVDDDLNTLELLCEIGRDAGWMVHGFTHLSGLRRSLDEVKPTLLILDDDLPDGRGGDLARELRDDDRMAAVPVLVCTAAHPMRQAEIGAWAPVVSKPFDLSQIEAFLGAAARRHEGSGHYDQRAG
jgi:two-component system, OmpR family, response regulator